MGGGGGFGMVFVVVVSGDVMLVVDGVVDVVVP